MTIKKSFKKGDIYLIFLLQFFPIENFSQNRSKSDSILHILINDGLSPKKHTILLETISFYYSRLRYDLGHLDMIFTSNLWFNKAKSTLNKAIEILKRLRDSYSVSAYFDELSIIYKTENNVRITEIKLSEAFLLTKNSGLKEQIKDFSMLLFSYKDILNPNLKILIQLEKKFSCIKAIDSDTHWIINLAT